MNINITMLERRVALINDMLGVSQEPYASERDESGRLIANTGTHYIDSSNGGYRLESMCKGGGARDISPRLTKRALADWVNAYISGIEIGRKQ